MSTNISPISLLERIIILQEKTGEEDSNRAKESDDQSLVIHNQHEIETEIPSMENTGVLANMKMYEDTLQNAVDSFSRNPDLQMFQLGIADVKLLAHGYKRIITDNDNNIHIDHIKEASSLSLSEFIPYLRSLEERSIFYRGGGFSPIARYSISSVIDTSGYISEYLINCLLGKNCRQTLMAMICGEQLNCETPMEKIYNYYLALNEFSPEMCERDFDDDPNFLGFIVGYYLEALWQQIVLLDSPNPLLKLITDYQLNKMDFCILILTYCYERQKGFDIGDIRLCNWLSGSLTEYDKNRKYLRDGCVPISKGNIKMLGKAGEYFRNLRISGKLLSDLQKLAEGESNPKQSSILKDNSDTLSIINPSQGLDSLILAEDEYRVINTIIQRFRDPQQYDLSKWGLMTPSLSSNTEALNACVMLLYGYPGTGKTHSAGVIANELGRQLVKIEASNLRNYYYGVTEKNVQKLFANMRKIIDELNPAPVFLLNEADQLIHRRSTDFNGNLTAVENSIQDVFLEELETFPGILIVTTNLADIMDEAMGRRFHYKLELKKPDVVCAEKLWRLHLPDTIPGAQAIDCTYLAKRNCFTGGQIRIIVQNACFEAMLRGSSSVLTLQDIETYAAMENAGQESPQKSIGF